MEPNEQSSNGISSRSPSASRRSAKALRQLQVAISLPGVMDKVCKTSRSSVLHIAEESLGAFNRRVVHSRESLSPSLFIPTQAVVGGLVRTHGQWDMASKQVLNFGPDMLAIKLNVFISP